MNELTDRQTFWMVYPTFEPIEHRGCIIPRVLLPRDFKNKIPDFYSQGRKENIELYTKQVTELLSGTPFELSIRLQWNNSLGLEHISAGGGGLDLNDSSGWPCFQEHNIGTNSGFVTGIIATKYVSELLKSS